MSHRNRRPAAVLITLILLAAGSALADGHWKTITGEAFEFDCVTEIWFDDMEASLRSVQVLATKAAALTQLDRSFGGHVPSRAGGAPWIRGFW